MQVRGLDQWAREALERATRGVEAEVRDVGGEILSDARARWPVRTGASRDGLTLRLRRNGSIVRAVISGAAWYTYWVRLVGGKAGSAFGELVRRPIRAGKRDIVKRLMARLVVEVRRG